MRVSTTTTPLLSLALALCFVQVLATFEGTWIDNDKRVLTLCITDNNKLQGSYQQIGLMQGIVNGNTASGTFYVAVHPSIGCRVRNFQWVLQPSNSALNGTWTCTDRPSSIQPSSITFSSGHWNAVRQSTFATPATCGVLATSGSMSGRWNYGQPGTWDFCTDATTYRSSYEFVGTTTGRAGHAYAYGDLYENGRVGIGLWAEATNVQSSDNNAGTNLIALGSDGQLFEYYWILPADDSDVIKLNPQKHGTVRVSKFSDTSTTQLCTRNQAFAIVVGESSVLGMSIAVVVMLVATCLSAFVL